MALNVTCGYCGRAFSAQRSTARFCSAHCKSYFGFRAKAKSMGVLKCVQCGKEYQPEWPTQRRFCCRSCEVTYSHRHLWKKHEMVCEDCGETFLALRKDCRRCHSCYSKHRSKSAMLQRLKKDPTVRVGAGSGGCQTPVGWSGRDGHAARDRKCCREAGFGVCQLCGWAEFLGVLETHHIDHNPRNGELINLVLLCPTCHKTIHFLIREELRSGRDFTFELCVEVFQRRAEEKSRKTTGNSSFLPGGQSDLKAVVTRSQGQRLLGEGLQGL